MRLAAREGAAQRLAATRYTACRDHLMRSPYRSSLPGFLFQCLTLYRFQEFIRLYDPLVESRLAFLDEAFQMTDVPPPPPPRRQLSDAWIDLDS